MHWAPPLIGITTQMLVVSIMILRILDRHENIDTPKEELNTSYDYIVVGSGSAGAIVAHRLAEDGKTMVLLLEAGPPASIMNDIPAQATTGRQFSGRYDWNYTMEKQPVGIAYKNGIPETRGFGIGGTSSINTMIFNRGNRRDFDAWAKDYGAVGWSYKDVMPYFLKYENNQDPLIVSQNQGFHSTKGPLEITSFANPDPLMEIHQKIINTEAGIPTTDINGANQVGTGYAQACIDSRGVRASASNAYIDPNPFPHNLHIISGALVTRIVFDGKTATGVLLERHGVGYKVRAKKEIIISGGVIGSPQLLLLSGVGPAEQLQKLNIPVVKDLPVGENFQGHPSLMLNFLIKPKSLPLLNVMSSLTTGQLFQWSMGQGPLATHHRGLTYTSTSSNKDKDWPNVGWETTVYQFTANLSDFSQFAYNDQKAWDQFYTKNYLSRWYMFTHMILQRVRSRGYVRLASTNPHVQPIINPKFLEHPQDYADFLEFLIKVIKFYELSSISEHLEPLPEIPNCKRCPNKYVFECESYIRCMIREILYSSYHPVGTCRMGDPKRKDVVVDPQLRVKGLDRLRVCDNSIIPLLQNANTNAAALMIGEKCADTIRGHSDHNSY